MDPTAHYNAALRELAVARVRQFRSDRRLRGRPPAPEPMMAALAFTQSALRLPQHRDR